MGAHTTRPMLHCQGSTTNPYPWFSSRSRSTRSAGAPTSLAPLAPWFSSHSRSTRSAGCAHLTRSPLPVVLLSLPLHSPTSLPHRSSRTAAAVLFEPLFVSQSRSKNSRQTLCMPCTACRRRRKPRWPPRASRGCGRGSWSLVRKVSGTKTWSTSLPTMYVV